MVSKGNNKRNTTRKEAKKVETPEKPIEEKPIVEKPIEEKPKEEKKPEFSIEDFRNKIVLEVVSLLKPDLEKKLNEISKQVTTEMQDIRTHLSQPSTSGNGDSEEIAEEEITQNPPMQSQQSMQNLAQNPILEMVLRLMEQLLKPQRTPDNTETLMKMMLQTQARQNMSNSSFDDWFGMEIKKDMARKFLNKEVPDKVLRTQEHFMKPIRNAGDEAYKAEQQAKQESDKHE